MAVSTRTILDLTGMLTQAGHVLERRLAAALAAVGLSPRVQCVLVHAMEGEHTQRELAELAYLDKTTMVAIADELEAAGLARRVPAASDRRKRIIEVTDAGRAAAAEGQAIVDRVHREALAELSPADRSVFTSALGALVDGPLSGEDTGPVDGVRRPRRK